MNLDQIFTNWFNCNTLTAQTYVSVHDLIEDFNTYTGVKILEHEMFDMLYRYDVTVVDKIAYGIKLWYKDGKMNTRLFIEWFDAHAMLTDGQSSIQDLVDSFNRYSTYTINAEMMRYYLSAAYNVETQSEVVVGVRLK